MPLPEGDYLLRYKLRTLLILLAVLPPLLGVAWVKYAAWKAEQERQRQMKEITDGLSIQFWIDQDTDLTIWTQQPPQELPPVQAPAKAGE